MPRTRECDYCGADIDPGTGTMFVRTNGTTVHFCSGKCEKNADLGREPRDLEWTAAGREAGGEAAPEPEEPDVAATDSTEAELETAEAAPDLGEAEADIEDTDDEPTADEPEGEDAEEETTDADAEDEDPAEAEAAAEADEDDTEVGETEEEAGDEGSEDGGEETEEAEA